MVLLDFQEGKIENFFFEGLALDHESMRQGYK